MSRGSDAFTMRVTTFSLRLVILKVLVLLMATWTETLTTQNKPRVHSPEQATIDEAKDFGRVPERGRDFLECSAKQAVEAWLPEDEEEASKKCGEQNHETMLTNDTLEGECGLSYKLGVGAEVKVTFPSVSRTCDMIFTAVQQATFTFSCTEFALSRHQQEYLYVNSGASLGRVYHATNKPAKMEGIKQLYLLYTREEEKASKESQVECFIRVEAMKGAEQMGRELEEARGGIGRSFNAEGQQASNCSTVCGLSPAFSGEIRIVGGTKVLEGKYPWVVGVYPMKEKTEPQEKPGLSFDTMICGGTIITKRIILTVAHCVHSSLAVLVVVPGMCKPQSYFADSYYMHPDFDPSNTENDVALLILEEELKWDKGVSPICLAPPKDREGEMAIVAGRGFVETLTQEEIAEGKRHTSQDLQEVTVEIWKQSRCEKAYENDRDLKIYNGNLCAASPGKDSCKGDSGGPLMVLDKGIWYQVGVVSGGSGCGIMSQPGVYTQVSSFIPWILSHAVGSC